ncbi:MAG: methyltransferase domain-containing protein [Methanomicrobiales archaeon]
MPNKFNIEGPIFIGRSWQEYIKMFNLHGNVLGEGKILDCAAGASSFTAKMNQEGYDITALDEIYDKSPDYLQNKCKKHLQVLINALSTMEGHFLWGYFQDLADLKRKRMKACCDFAADYKKNHGKNYIKADITQIPYNDNSFSLVLCSHLLFIYDHRLSYDFHKKSILEMLRVGKEVRIYPLVKHKSKKSEYLTSIMDDLSPSADLELVNVDYEFRKGGNQMLQILKN